MRSTTTLVATSGLVALVLSGLAAAETVSGSIGSADRVYTFVADTSQSARATAMWSKGRSDLDLYIYWLDDEEPVLIGASFASGEKLEIAELGVLGDGVYSVVLSRFSGPSTKFNLNVSTSGSEIVSFSGSNDRDGGRLRFAGELQTLSAQDPYFAVMEQQVERWQRLKRRWR